MTTKERAWEYAEREIKIDKKIIVTPEELKEMAVDFYMAGHAEATRWRSMHDGDFPEYNRKVLVKIYSNPFEYEIDIDEFVTNGYGLDWFNKHDNDVDCWRYID